MEKRKYKTLVERHTPKENIFKNGTIAFLVGGFMGVLGEFIIEVYSYIFHIPSKEAAPLMTVTLILIGCLLTCLGFFDKWVGIARCGLIVPITGFAHSIQSAALEYKKEGLITGIGANLFKLAGTVIIFGVVSAYFFGLIKVILMGVM
jgi:SpoVA protein.